MKGITILMVFLCWLSILTGQTRDYFEIALKDKSNNEPVSFATVRFKASRQGLIADAQGEFRLPVGFQNTETVLVITSIGYESIEIETSQLALNRINLFYLTPYVGTLDAVMITNDISRRRKVEEANALVRANRAKTADELIYLAIQNIPKNLSSSPSSVLGYYRDYQVLDNEYVNLNEGIIETFDEGINTTLEAFESFKASIFSYESNPEFTVDTTLTIPYDPNLKFIEMASIRANGGNEFTILQVHNIVRNYKANTFSFVYTFATDFLDNHKSRREGIEYIDDEPLAIIKFRTPPEVQGYYHRVFGSFLISLKDYSIHRFNYEIFEIDVKEALANVNLEFKRENGKMFLNFITFNNRFILGNVNELREMEIEFFPETFTFRFFFNKDIDYLSLKTSFFNFRYNNRKLMTDEIYKVNSNTIDIQMKPFLRSSQEVANFNFDNFEYTLRKLKDSDGFEIYEVPPVFAYQFREYFIQEVFPKKELPDNKPFMINHLPLETSIQDITTDVSKYWLNTPLRNSVIIE